MRHSAMNQNKVALRKIICAIFVGFFARTGIPCAGVTIPATYVGGSGPRLSRVHDYYVILIRHFRHPVACVKRGGSATHRPRTTARCTYYPLPSHTHYHYVRTQSVRWRSFRFACARYVLRWTGPFNPCQPNPAANGTEHLELLAPGRNGMPLKTQAFSNCRYAW